MSNAVAVGIAATELAALSAAVKAIRNSVSHVSGQVDQVSGTVGALRQEHSQTQCDLAALVEEFRRYVSQDYLDKQLQLAETRVVKVRQELTENFGHYLEVRRRALGILQSSDLALVRQETMRGASEESMLNAPKYWLAAANVALCAWIADNRELAHKALGESLRRDDNKTSLFFALICRRTNKFGALDKWLTRYFMLQSPNGLDREVVTMIDALANGIFGEGARRSCVSVIDTWLEELAENANYANEQRERWKRELIQRAGDIPENEYPALKGHSTNWNALGESLSKVRRHQHNYAYFSGVLSEEIVPPKSLYEAVDEILNSLVTNYDDEELPLRRDERRLTLVIEHNGDTAKADERVDDEMRVYDELTSFATVLTNVSMRPELVHATRASQKFALALSRHWILDAHQDLVAEDRRDVPQHAKIRIDDFECEITDGSEEAQLTSRLSGHFEKIMDDTLSAIRLRARAIIVLLVGATMGFGAGGVVDTILFLCALGYFGWEYRMMQNAKAVARARIQAAHNDARAALRACAAEMTDYRKDWLERDSESCWVVTLFEDLESGEQIQGHFDTGRHVLVGPTID